MAAKPETAFERVNAARKEVDKSSISPEHKDVLQARLDHAAGCRVDDGPLNIEGLLDVVVTRN